MEYHDTDAFLIFCRSIRRNDPGIVEIQCDYDSEAMVEHLCESLIENTVVHTYTVELSVMEEHEMVALAELLERNVTLKTLNVDCRGGNVLFKGEGIPRFTEALAHCHLQKIRICNKHVSYAGFISYFCDSLAQNSTIRTLDLYAMFIRDYEAIALGEALHTNSSIQALQLKKSSISDFGTIHICNGLQQNCTVTDMRWDAISSRGMLAVIDMLKKNTSIKKLDIEVCESIGKETEETLVRTIIEHNFTLEEIAVSSLSEYSTQEALSSREILETITGLNTDGLRCKIMKHTNDIPVGLWAHIFAFRGGRCIDVLFYLVNSKPELFKL